VLIVDDHEGFRSAARALLEAGGFTVVGEAASGSEAPPDHRRSSTEAGTSSLNTRRISKGLTDG
jgi:DNA-binding NarL/FixJ family response regulator